MWQVQIDGRPIESLYTNREFIADVTARFSVYYGTERQQQNQELADEIEYNREQSGGGIDAATLFR